MSVGGKHSDDWGASERTRGFALAPELPGFDIDGACFPAEYCSGDFFDYIPLPNDRLAIVLADATQV